MFVFVGPGLFRRDNSICPVKQSSYHTKFLLQRVVGFKVEILVGMGGFPVNINVYASVFLDGNLGV